MFKQLLLCIKWLWQSLQGVRLHLSIASMTGVVQVLLSLTFIWASKQMIDIATGKHDGQLTTYILLAIGCMAIQPLLSALGTRVKSKAEIKQRNALQLRLFNQLIHSKWSGRESLHTGDMVNRMDEDVNVVTTAMCWTIPSIFVTCVQLVCALLFLAYMDTRLALILFIIMPVAILLSKGYIRKMRRLTREIRESDSRVKSYMQEHLGHRSLITALQQEESVSGRFYDLIDTYGRQILYRTNYTLFSRTMVQWGFSAGYLTAFIWGVIGLKDGSVTFAMMTAFLQLVAQIQRPIVELSRQIPSFIHVSTSIDRLVQIEDLPVEKESPSTPLGEAPGVRITNVSYTYPDGDEPTIAHFTHDFAPGTVTAIVGETGIGKSTLTRLILAQLTPQQGNITFYNRRGEESPVGIGTRCNVVYIPQGNTLLSGTIRSNLLLGNPHATEEELRKALHIAAADFVYDLPEGIDSTCGEKGIGLSEGQAQRIAIARGILRPGGIVMMDEPTSSLDGETEQTMLQRLSENLTGRTFIIVTHRQLPTHFCNTVINL